MNYSGIDLHSNNSVITVTDDEDRVVAEKRLPNDLGKILAFLLPWQVTLAGVVVESTFNWYWPESLSCCSTISSICVGNMFTPRMMSISSERPTILPMRRKLREVGGSRRVKSRVR